MQPQDPNQPFINPNPVAPAPQPPLQPQQFQAPPQQQFQQTAAYQQPYQQQSFSANSTQKSKKGLIIAVIVIALAVVFLVGAVSFALSKTKSTSTSQQTPPLNEVTKQSTESDAPASAAAAAATAATLTKTPLSQVITTDLGYTIQLNEIVHNYTPEHAQTGREYLLVKVTVSADSPKYTGASPYSNDMSILADSKPLKRSLAISEQELTRAGYTPLAIVSAKKGSPNSGYVAFDAPTGTKAFGFRFTQPQTKVISGSTGSTVIPAKDYDVAL